MMSDDEWLAALADRLDREWTKNYPERGCRVSQQRRMHYRQNRPYETDEYLATHDDIDLRKHMGVPQKHLAFPNVPLRDEVKGWLNIINYTHRPTYEDQAEQPDLFGTGILFWGPGGTGKTVAAVDLLTRLVRLGIRGTDPDLRDISWHGKSMGRFTSWQNASELFRQAASGDGVAGEWLDDFTKSVRGGGDPLVRANFLVLDDISRERHTEFNSGELHRILRYRVEWGYATIITTNHAPSEWEGVYGQVLAAFLSRSFVPVEFADYGWQGRAG